jgi:hypothetical protein
MFTVTRHHDRWYVVFEPTGRTVTSANSPLYACALARKMNKALAR